MSEHEEGRSARVKTLKKLIVAFLVLGILLPILLCILLFIKVDQLQRRVNELEAASVRETEMSDEMSGQTISDMAITKVHEADVAASPEMSQTGQPLIISEEVSYSQSESQMEEDTNVTKVYLTFDDGPSSNTDEILDILKQYDVKATFFVNGKTQDMYLPLYRRIVEEGHTLGMHSYTHRYHEIYASKEQFSEDLEMLQEFLYDATGVWSRFYRFPGGSSNDVSDVPMEELTEYLTDEDIFYLDWNVSCADATGRKLRPQQIADNVTQNVSKYGTAVVLLHDASDKTSTVEALPLIIETLLAMEQVEILPVDDEMTMVHHQ